MPFVCLGLDFVGGVEEHNKKTQQITNMPNKLSRSSAWERQKEDELTENGKVNTQQLWKKNCEQSKHIS